MVLSLLSVQYAPKEDEYSDGESFTMIQVEENDLEKRAANIKENVSVRPNYHSNRCLKIHEPTSEMCVSSTTTVDARLSIDYIAQPYFLRA